MIENITPKAVVALRHIERAARLGSPLDRTELKERLGYSSHGAVANLVNVLVEAGFVKVDTRHHPAILRPVDQEAA